MLQFGPTVYSIMIKLLSREKGFAVSNEPSVWSNGLRFTIYDVRSHGSIAEGDPFDGIIWMLEDGMKDAGFPVAAVLKGKKLCMLDVDCRTHLETAEATTAAEA